MKTTSLWTEATRTHVARHAAAVSLLALAACGGGGGGGGAGGGGSPPPPPPPANAAPSAVVTITDATPDEGQPFTLDGSTSSDTNNDPLTFSWRQTAGPAATIPDATLAKLENLRAPEVTENKVGTFELTVSDGKTTSKKSVNVTFTNIYQTPRFAAAPALITTLPVGGYIEVASDEFRSYPGTFLGVSAVKGGDINLLELRHPNATTFELLPTAQTLSALTQPVKLVQVDGVAAATPENILSVQEDANALKAYSKTGTDNAVPLLEKAARTLTKPCTVYDPYYNLGRVVVGQRDGGFVVVERTAPDADGNFMFNEFQKLGGPESFCAFAEASYPTTGSDQFTDGGPTILKDLLAYDENTNSVSLFAQDTGTTPSTARYMFRQKTQLELGAQETLNFVKAVTLYKDNTIPYGLALLFTNGQHAGVHRMVIVGVDPDRRLVQETLSWSVGVPTDVVSFLSGPSLNRVAALAVITETSPDAIVFKPAVASNPADTFISPMTGPEYFEIGLGATLGHVANYSIGGSADYDLVVMDSRNKQARIYGPLK